VLDLGRDHARRQFRVRAAREPAKLHDPAKVVI
jgi:hypothetical protein